MAELSLTEEDSIEYFYSLKWPNGFRCPQCGHSHAYTIHTRKLPLYQCHNCRHQTTITAGTIMENSRTPLHKWRTALKLLSDTASVNAVQLSAYIHVSYKTAWSMLRKIRQAISDMDTKQLLGDQVCGDIYLYGRRSLHPNILHPKEHPVVALTSYPSYWKPAYVKLKVVPQEFMEGKSLSRWGKVAFANLHVQPGTSGVDIHRKISLYDDNRSSLFGRAKEWITNTFHGIGPKYLQSYWDEYCFRINQSYREAPVLETLSRICLAT